MRQRTKEEIDACPHSEGFVVVTHLWEYGLRGDMGFAIKGCPQCGGMIKEMRTHLNYGHAVRTRAQMEAGAAEERDRARAEVRAWREALPEPEEYRAADPDLPAVARAPASAPRE